MIKLGYCEIYKPHHHGFLENYNINDKIHIYTSLLYQFNITLNEFYDESENSIKKEWEINGPWKIALSSLNNKNPYIRNTVAIKLNTLEILKIINYKDYQFCIIKTFWLRLLQRKFKRYYKKHLLKRIQFKNILNRNVHGKWCY
jgi:hypothetical protein